MVLHLFYEEQAPGDIGTMFAAKNHLNAFNVTKKAMANVDATYEFVEQFLKAQIITMYREVMSSNPPPNETADGMNDLLNKMVDTFIIPGLETESVDDIFTCKICQKRFLKMTGLRDHQKHKHGTEKKPDPEKEYKCFFPCSNKRKFPSLEHLRSHLIQKHKFVFPEGENNTFRCSKCDRNFKTISGKDKHELRMHSKKDEEKNNIDSIYRYSCCSAGVCLLAVAFNTARQNGDGDRVMRYYKYMLLLYKLDGRTKYSHYVFQMLQCINELFPEKLAFDVVYNRFTNTEGKPNSNVEIDRKMEHLNKKVKQDIKDFNGNVTRASLKRASHSYQGIDECLHSYDNFAEINKRSSRHSKNDDKEDVLSLADQMTTREVFMDHKDGRCHQAFPAFSDNLFKHIDMYNLKE